MRDSFDFLDGVMAIFASASFMEIDRSRLWCPGLLFMGDAGLLSEFSYGSELRNDRAGDETVGDCVVVRPRRDSIVDVEGREAGDALRSDARVLEDGVEERTFIDRRCVFSSSRSLLIAALGTLATETERCCLSGRLWGGKRQSLASSTTLGRPTKE